MSASSDTSMRAILRCGEPPPALGWEDLLLDTRVAGLPLLNRHLLALRGAGILEVTLAVPAAIRAQMAARAPDCVPAGISFSVVPDGTVPADAEGGLRLEPELPALSGVEGQFGAQSQPVLEQRADTLVDPRLLAQIVRLVTPQPFNMVCLDVAGPNTPKSKSPYVLGVPEADEARPVDTRTAGPMVPVGVVVRVHERAPTIAFGVRRYYWHRLARRDDAPIATTKVLLATMKASDGAFARTNRRVSLRISRLLLNTGVTANMVTVATLACGLLAGWLMSLGHYATFVAGSVAAWFASMLDGVDGELARAKFQASPFGHWLEMACDYVFYVALFVGLGAGYHRVTGHVRWSVMGIGAGIGAVLSFVVVAHMKRNYAREGGTGEFALAYERAATTPSHNLFTRLTPHLTAFFTRAVFPYFLVAFALVGWLKVALVLMFISTQAFWIVALILARLRVAPTPTPPPPSATPAQIGGADS